jgi:hypothetical protein
MLTTMTEEDWTIVFEAIRGIAVAPRDKTTPRTPEKSN